MSSQTFYPNADPESVSVDGFVGRNVANETWAAIRDAITGTSASDSGFGCQVNLIAADAPNTNRWTGLSRGIFLSDTSALAGITPTAAVLHIYVDSLADDLGLSLDVVDVTPDSNTAIIVTDYAQFGTTLLGTISVSSLTPNAYNAITLNPTGLAAIATSGITKLGLRLSADRTNTPPTWGSGSTTSVTFLTAEIASGFRPYLEVTYDAAEELMPQACL